MRVRDLRPVVVVDDVGRFRNRILELLRQQIHRDARDRYGRDHDRCRSAHRVTRLSLMRRPPGSPTSVGL